MKKIKKLIGLVYKDHLYRNSVYLIVNNLITAGFGFFFWMICARLFTTVQVGYATTIISAIGLVGAFSFLGLNVALIRYLPKAKDKARLIGSCINLTALVAILAALIFLLLVPILSPKLMFMVNSKIYFIMFVVYTLFWVLFSMVNSVFIAARKAKMVLIKSIIFSVCKLVLPMLLVFLGSFGILGAYYISALIGFGFTLFFLKYKLVVDFGLIKKMFTFSASNYVAGIFGMMPGLVLPLMITNIAGPESTAYFYVAWTITGLLFFIPGAVSQTLLTEGSYNSKKLSQKVRKAYIFSFTLLVPGVLLITFLGKYLLLLFGANYSLKGFQLLQVLAISSLFYGINQIRIMKFNILHQVRKVILIQLVVVLITLGGGYLIADGNLLLFGVLWGVGNLVGGAVR